MKNKIQQTRQDHMNIIDLLKKKILGNLHLLSKNEKVNIKRDGTDAFTKKRIMS